MPVHKLVTKPGIYFITFTCYNWMPLIEITGAYDLVYKWFDVLTKKGHAITAYVIMPNHLHLLLYYSGGKQSLNKVIGNGKRFLAYEIISRLEKRNETGLLYKLKLAVKPSDKKRGKKHEVWEESFDVKECRTEKFVMQKLSYIHSNPCSGKWRLAKDAIHYQHSSACFYISGRHLGYVVKDYREFLRNEFDE